MSKELQSKVRKIFQKYQISFSMHGLQDRPAEEVYEDVMSEFTSLVLETKKDSLETYENPSDRDHAIIWKNHYFRHKGALEAYKSLLLHFDKETSEDMKKWIETQIKISENEASEAHEEYLKLSIREIRR